MLRVPAPNFKSREGTPAGVLSLKAGMRYLSSSKPIFILA